jgi:hypothetical protein
VLTHLDFEIALGHRDIDRAAGKSVADRGLEFPFDADFLDRGDGRREIGAVAR